MRDPLSPAILNSTRIHKNKNYQRQHSMTQHKIKELPALALNTIHTPTLTTRVKKKKKNGQHLLTGATRRRD
jgi:hypothetical protein